MHSKRTVMTREIARIHRGAIVSPIYATRQLIKSIVFQVMLHKKVEQTISRLETQILLTREFSISTTLCVHRPGRQNAYEERQCKGAPGA